MMLEHGMVHLVATDCHGPTNRSPKLSKARKRVESAVGKTAAARIFQENPLAIVNGETITPFELTPLGRGFSSQLKRWFSFTRRREGAKKRKR
jgi:tyrosine-protein phosphatase YwqE